MAILDVLSDRCDVPGGVLDQELFLVLCKESVQVSCLVEDIIVLVLSWIVAGDVSLHRKRGFLGSVLLPLTVAVGDV